MKKEIFVDDRILLLELYACFILFMGGSEGYGHKNLKQNGLAQNYILQLVFVKSS